MSFFKTPQEAIDWMREELISTLQDDINDLEANQADDDEAEQIAELEAKIADLEALEDILSNVVEKDKYITMVSRMNYDGDIIDEGTPEERTFDMENDDTHDTLVQVIEQARVLI